MPFFHQWSPTRKMLQRILQSGPINGGGVGLLRAVITASQAVPFRGFESISSIPWSQLWDHDEGASFHRGRLPQCSGSIGLQIPTFTMEVSRPFDKSSGLVARKPGPREPDNPMKQRLIEPDQKRSRSGRN